MFAPTSHSLHYVYRSLRDGPMPMAKYMNDLGYSVNVSFFSVASLNYDLSRLRIWVKGSFVHDKEGRKRPQYLKDVHFINKRVRECFVSGMPLATYTRIRHGIVPNERGFVLLSRGGSIHAVESLMISL